MKSGPDSSSRKRYLQSPRYATFAMNVMIPDVYGILWIRTFLAFLSVVTTVMLPKRCSCAGRAPVVSTLLVDDALLMLRLLLLTSELVAVTDAAADAAAGRVSLPVPCPASARSRAAVVAMPTFDSFPYYIIIIIIIIIVIAVAYCSVLPFSESNIFEASVVFHNLHKAIIVLRQVDYRADTLATICDQVKEN